MATYQANTSYDPSMRSTGRSEGRVARAIEKKTSRLPSDLFLWAAGASIVGSMAFQMMRSRKREMGGFRFSPFSSRPTRNGQLSLFIGQWAPTFLLLGIYNKLVKVAGSDRVNPNP
jgi:hypothetical protein